SLRTFDVVRGEGLEQEPITHESDEQPHDNQKDLEYVRHNHGQYLPCGRAAYTFSTPPAGFGLHGAGGAWERRRLRGRGLPRGFGKPYIGPSTRACNLRSPAMPTNLNRRQFLDLAVVGASGLAVSLSAKAQDVPPPSERVVVGVMGLSRG